MSIWWSIAAFGLGMAACGLYAIWPRRHSGPTPGRPPVPDRVAAAITEACIASRAWQRASTGDHTPPYGTPAYGTPARHGRHAQEETR